MSAIRASVVIDGSGQDLLVLRGTAITDQAGACHIQLGGNVQTLQFEMMLPEYMPDGSCLCFVEPPHVVATHLTNWHSFAQTPAQAMRPVFLTASIDQWRPLELHAEDDEQYRSTNLSGARCGELRIQPNYEVPGIGVELIFQSWASTGEPAAGIEFSWQAAGEARYMKKSYLTEPIYVPPGCPDPVA